MVRLNYRAEAENHPDVFRKQVIRHDSVILSISIDKDRVMQLIHIHASHWLHGADQGVDQRCQFRGSTLTLKMSVFGKSTYSMMMRVDKFIHLFSVFLIESSPSENIV